MTSLTDPQDNTTTRTFDPLGRVATETIMVSSSDLDRAFRYDAARNLVRKIDHNRQVIDFAYDSRSRQMSESWYDDVTDTDAEQNVRKMYTTTYDDNGNRANTGDATGDQDRLTGQPPRRRDAEKTTRCPDFSASRRFLPS